MNKLNKKILIPICVILIAIIVTVVIFLTQPGSDLKVQLTTESAQHEVEVTAIESPESTGEHRVIEVSLNTKKDSLKTDKIKSTKITIDNSPYTVTLLSPDLKDSGEKNSSTNDWDTVYSYDSKTNQINIIHRFNGDGTNSQLTSNTYNFK